MANDKTEIRNSISSIYSQLLNKRANERELKIQQKAEEVNNDSEEIVEQKDDIIKMSKKEKRAAEIDNWKSVISELVGDDFAFEEKKEKKKKYKKWIDEEDDNKVIEVKQKKKKKRNYHKEFEPELNTLRKLLTEQNKFTDDIQKRFTNAIGPANKDAMPPNKTMVELASVINASRSNALGLLRELGSVKKTIADLSMKQKKLLYDLQGEISNHDSNDLMLLGSTLMNNLDPGLPNMNQTITPSAGMAPPVNQSSPVIFQNNTYGYEPVPNAVPTAPNIQEFDPSTWNSNISLPDNQVLYENIPKSIVVEKNTSTGDMRFKAIRNDNGEEIVGFPGLPTVNPSTLKINEKDKIVKGTFDETYKLEIV